MLTFQINHEPCSAAHAAQKPANLLFIFGVYQCMSRHYNASAQEKCCVCPVNLHLQIGHDWQASRVQVLGIYQP